MEVWPVPALGSWPGFLLQCSSPNPRDLRGGAFLHSSEMNQKKKRRRRKTNHFLKFVKLHRNPSSPFEDPPSGPSPASLASGAVHFALSFLPVPCASSCTPSRDHTPIGFRLQLQGPSPEGPSPCLLPLSAHLEATQPGLSAQKPAFPFLSCCP